MNTNSWLKVLPQELITPTFINAKYEDILNLCDSEHANICQDPLFWWLKIKHELKKHEDHEYNLFILLREAIELQQWYYLNAAVTHYDGNDDNIYDLFYRYAFAINNLEIMKKYARKNIGGLLENIDDADKFINIIKYGYYTFAEYCNFIDQIITDIKPSVYDTLIKIKLPVRNHPNRYLFLQLIRKYIGMASNRVERKHDIRVFRDIIWIYQFQISDYQDFYNFIFDHYEINSIESDVYKVIYEIIYGDNVDESNIFIHDNAKKFQENYSDDMILGLIYYNQGNITLEMINHINGLLRYDMNLEINEHLFKMDFSNRMMVATIAGFYAASIKYPLARDPFSRFAISLSIQHLQLILKTLDDDLFHYFIWKFFLLWWVMNNSYQELVVVCSENIPKLNILINDHRFDEKCVKIFFLTNADKRIKSNIDSIVVLRNRKFRKYMRRLDYQIIPDNKEEHQYILITK